MTDLSQSEFIEADLTAGVLTVRLNRPDALNAFRPEMLHEIRRLVEQAEDDVLLSTEPLNLALHKHQRT